MPIAANIGGWDAENTYPELDIRYFLYHLETETKNLTINYVFGSTAKPSH